MSRVSTYLNFMGTTEEAFNFYRSVFGTEIIGEIARMGDMPGGPGAPELSEAERKMVAHVELPILAGHVLMGTDMLDSMGHELRVGNNVTICLEPDSRAETDRLYAVLSEGGSESTGMQQMPWAYWGCSLDRFGIRWMFNLTFRTSRHRYSPHFRVASPGCRQNEGRVGGQGPSPARW